MIQDSGGKDGFRILSHGWAASGGRRTIPGSTRAPTSMFRFTNRQAADDQSGASSNGCENQVVEK
jgi:hypothetical protein